jgi:hypothetical protein
MQNNTLSSHSRLTNIGSAFVLIMMALMTGCAIAPAPVAPVAAPAVQSLEQYMREAEAAKSAGSNDRAGELYRSAAKTYPVSKAPWLKLAEGYFEANNYGQAILAAQEVLQRDPTDSAATSVLAVSGLRVSSSALQMLRQQQQALNGGTREEAVDLARVLREQLGEPVLVPRPVAAVTPAVRKRPVVAAPKAAATPAPPTKSEASSPFSILR